jgi:hypothetical protein
VTGGPALDGLLSGNDVDVGVGDRLFTGGPPRGACFAPPRLFQHKIVSIDDSVLMLETHPKFDKKEDMLESDKSRPGGHPGDRHAYSKWQEARQRDRQNL